jgi:hypothetical protein
LRREHLERAANYYQVARSFSVDFDGLQRLDKALIELDVVLTNVNSILTPTNVDATVTTLAKNLGTIYINKRTGKPQELVSAASKFLWLRRRSPVVIFDGRAEGYLIKITGAPFAEYPSYLDYRSAWRAEFPKYEKKILSACRDLNHSNVKKFAPDSTARKRMKSMLGKRWFHERVFDKFLWWNGA